MLMCDAIDVAERIETPMAAAPPLLVVEVPEKGPATVAGIPLPDAMVEQLRATASVEPLLIDDDGAADRGREAWSQPVAEDRPGGAAARRALPVRQLRPALRAARPPPPTQELGWHRRALEPRRRRERAPSDADPEWALRPGRQPEPPRRVTHGPHQRPHPRRSQQVGLPAAEPDRTRPEWREPTLGDMWIRRTIAIVLLLVGLVWFFQGVGVIEGSFMTGEALWAVIGVVCIVAGCALLRPVTARSELTPRSRGCAPPSRRRG